MVGDVRYFACGSQGDNGRVGSNGLSRRRRGREVLNGGETGRKERGVGHGQGDCKERGCKKRGGGGDGGRAVTSGQKRYHPSLSLNSKTGFSSSGWSPFLWRVFAAAGLGVGNGSIYVKHLSSSICL